MKVREIVELRDKYGDITLGELVNKLLSDKKYKCPKCNGNGVAERIIFNGYYNKTVQAECDLCHGEGYTEREYKPKFIQNGWE